MAAYLAGHGVVAGGAITHAITAHVGAALLAIAGRKGADLIVAGGYGDSRLSEWVYRGATRELLPSSPICCLLSPLNNWRGDTPVVAFLRPTMTAEEYKCH